MGKRLKYIISVFSIALLLSIVNRGVFVIYNYSAVSDCSAWEILQCFLHGLYLDASIAGYITAIPLLATIITLWWPASWGGQKLWSVLLGGYFAIITLIVAIIETGDIGLFESWQSRIDAQVLIYTPKEMMASLTVGNIVMGVLYVGATLLIALYLFMGATRRWLLPQLAEKCEGIWRRLGYMLLLILAGGVLFIVMRGGVTTATANVSKAYFSNNALLNKIAINPVFSLIESASSNSSFEPFDYMSDAEAEQIFSQSLHDTTMISSIAGNKWLKSSRPDIVLVIMEGMGRAITDVYEGSEPVTPNLNSLRKEGIWFDNIYATSFRTDRGNVAILSGFPGQPTMSIMKMPGKATKLPGMASSLRNVGYNTRFFYGGDSNFTNTRAYLYSTGFDEVVDEKKLSLTGHRSKWGYADDVVFKFAADEIINRIDSSDAPSFETILTLSSHEPYKVPYSRLKDALLNSFAYTDDAIAKFVEQLRNSKAWDNMLLILIPDHSTMYPRAIGNHSTERHHIPMIWLGGAVREPLVVKEYMSQIDLVATLLAQMDIDHSEFTFSRDVCDPTVAHYAYWSYPIGFGIIDNEGKTIYDCTTDRIIDSLGSDNARREKLGKAWIEKTFMEIRKL